MKRAKQKPKALTPREARTHAQIVKLRRDNLSARGYWILLGGDGDDRNLTIAKQRTGERSEWMVSIRRRDFERLIDWYNTGSATRKPARSSQPRRRGR